MLSSGASADGACKIAAVLQGPEALQNCKVKAMHPYAGLTVMPSSSANDADTAETVNGTSTTLVIWVFSMSNSPGISAQ